MTVDTTTIVLASSFGIGLLALLRGVFLGYPAKSIPGDTLLSAKEQAIVAAASDTFFPSGGRLSRSGTEAGAVRYFEETLQDANSRLQTLIHLLLFFVEHAPWLWLRSRFTKLSSERRREMFNIWTRSDIYFLRTVTTSLRTLISFGYMADAQVCAAIGSVANATPLGQPNGSPNVVNRPVSVRSSAELTKPSAGVAATSDLAPVNAGSIVNVGQGATS